MRALLFGAVFEDLLALDLPEGRNLADEYLRRRGWQESADTRDYVAALHSNIARRAAFGHPCVTSEGRVMSLRIAAVGWAASGEVVATFSALLLGVFMVFIVGFAGAEVLHEAAHNTRHSIAFPCH